MQEVESKGSDCEAKNCSCHACHGLWLTGALTRLFCFVLSVALMHALWWREICRMNCLDCKVEVRYRTVGQGIVN